MPKDIKKTLKKEAENSIPVVPAFLVVLICGFSLGVLSGFIKKKLRESIGTDEFSWLGPLAAIILTIIGIFFYRIGILNPRIVQLLRDQKGDGITSQHSTLTTNPPPRGAAGSGGSEESDD